MSCLYILHINLLSVISFANIFFHSVDCVFVLSMASFAVKKKPLSLIRSYLFHFVFISLAFILLSVSPTRLSPTRAGSKST